MMMMKNLELIIFEAGREFLFQVLIIVEIDMFFETIDDWLS